MDEDVGHALRILVANFSKIASEVVRGMASPLSFFVATSVVAVDSETMGVCPSESSASFGALVSAIAVKQNAVRCSPECM